MSRLKALRAHWRQYPPLHKIAAAWAGYKPPEDTPKMTADDMRRLMTMTGGKVEGVTPR